MQGIPQPFCLGGRCPHLCLTDRPTFKKVYTLLHLFSPSLKGVINGFLVTEVFSATGKQ